MFWRFGGYNNTSSIDSLLDKPDCSLEEVLDENDIEQEIKSNNSKLIEFLRDDVNLGKLLKYVIAPKPVLSKEGTPTASEEKEKEKSGGFFGKSRSKVRSKSRGAADDDLEAREEKWRKYSFVSTQLLSAEVWSISEALLENTDVLREFWTYIKQDPELDNMQANNFLKVNESLLEKKGAEMAAFVKTIDGFVDYMIRHVNCPVMMDVLLKIIGLEKDSAPGIVDWLQSQDLIPKLLAYITPDHPNTIQTAAGDFLKAIIAISANATGQDATAIGPNELTRQLVSDSCVEPLLSQMLQGGNPLTVGVGIIIEVIRKNNSDYDQDTQVGPEPKSSDPIYLGTLLRIFAEHINDFMDLILSPKHAVATENGSAKITRKDLSTAWGARIEPLGFDRFKTCELMAELLHCSNMGLLNEKGAEADVQRRDTERDRLKAEGKLAAERRAESSTDFAASVDSQGFHHAEAFSPLGESPENVRSPPTTSTGIEGEFEKIDLGEVPSTQGQAKSAEESDIVTGSIPSQRPAPSKRRSSLLTEQLQREKEKALKRLPESSPDADDKPAPLFSKRQQDVPAEAMSSEPDQSDEAQPQQTQTEPADASAVDGAGVQQEDDGSPVVGDLLKIKFVEHRVVPTIIDFFFRFPWNNFLHNVVYDVVQQVFNGAMDRGYNRELAVDLFESGRMTERVVEGQKRSDESQQKQKMRLGYMGHLTLIAEEVVKFTERQPTETLSPLIAEKVANPEWTAFVENVLTETRERDNAILGGVRPDNNLGPRQAVLNAVNAAQGGGVGGNAMGGLSSNGGLDSLDLANAGAAGYGIGGNASANLMSGFGGSDDEEEEELEEADLGGDSTDEVPRQRSAGQSIEDEDQTDKPAPLSISPQSTKANAIFKTRRRNSNKRSNSSNEAPSFSQALSSSSTSDFPTDTPPSSSDSASNEGKTNASLKGKAATDVDFPGLDDGTAPAGTSKGFDDDFADSFASDDADAGTSSDDHGARRHTGSEDTASDDGSDDSNEHDNAEDGGTVRPLRRQTTQEALVRRPLDDGESSDEDGHGSHDEKDENNDNDTGEDMSDERRALRRVSSATERGRRASQANAARQAEEAVEATKRQESRDHEESKRKEQEKLLKRWGFEEDSEEEEEEEEDDEEPVSIGNYLSRRRTES